MLARDLRCALDPVVFAAERLSLALDPWQCDVLRGRRLRELLNVTRQGGKSKSTAVGVLHEGNYRASKTIVISPSQRQSSLLLASVQELAELAKIRTRPHPGDDPGLLLPRGELICLPGAEATTRGFGGCTWLIVDEAARVPDALFYSAKAYLATVAGARVWLLSTPFGKRGFFYVEHEAGRYRVTRVLAVDCPRISAEFLEGERRSLPAPWFRQEYCCEFTTVEHAMFDHDLVMQSIDLELEPLGLPLLDPDPLEPLLCR